MLIKSIIVDVLNHWKLVKF